MDSEPSDRSRIAVIVLLAVQVILFLVSVNAFMSISIFCSVTAGRAPPFFTVIHFAYLGLFLLGIASLFWRPCRRIYIAAIVVALLALPVQLWLLDSGHLTCDGLGREASISAS